MQPEIDWYCYMW